MCFAYSDLAVHNATVAPGSAGGGGDGGPRSGPVFVASCDLRVGAVGKMPWVDVLENADTGGTWELGEKQSGDVI